MNKAYLVLSVRQVNALARAVARHRKAGKAKMSHTIVLHLDVAPGHVVGGREQISHESIENSIARLNHESHNMEFEARRVDKSLALV